MDFSECGIVADDRGCPAPPQGLREPILRRIRNALSAVKGPTVGNAICSEPRRAILPRMPEQRSSAFPSPRRVLVVDDNPDACETLALLLELMGHEARTASDGPSALKAGMEFEPQVVLLDIGLPHMNGYEVCRRLRAQDWGRRAHVVALTGWGQAEDEQLAVEAGFDRHLVKPVEEDVLQRVLRDAG
jgi:CheY-like chemotaxis protein